MKTIIVNDDYGTSIRATKIEHENDPSGNSEETEYIFELGEGQFPLTVVEYDDEEKHILRIKLTGTRERIAFESAFNKILNENH